MNKVFKVAIIGGGASGLACAVELLSGDNALSGEDVVILERNERVGKKILATGNGQCNLTNSSLSILNFHGDKSFIKTFFEHSKKDLISYFENLGIFLTEEENGKMYPVSMQATSVLDCIRYYLEFKGCKILTNFFVSDFNLRDGIFKVESTDNFIKCENLVCAFGGKAGKQYGTDGQSYDLLTKFGHKISNLYPSLVQLKTKLGAYKGLKGVKERAKVTAKSNCKVIFESLGDVLFTEYGLSGSAIFNVSGALQGVENPMVSVEFLPSISYDELLKILKRKASLKHLPQGEILTGLVNKQLGKIICKNCDTLEQIAKKVKNLEFFIEGNLGFNYAQVTKGGIKTDDVNPYSMQSKKVKNLYLTGELLDVDGDCGGYNLSFAFLSGIKVGENIKERKI